MTPQEALASDVYRFLPKAKQETLARAAKAGGMSIGAAIAFSLAQQPIRDYCDPKERAKVAGLLMVTFAAQEDAA